MDEDDLSFSATQPEAEQEEAEAPAPVYEFAELSTPSAELFWGGEQR